MWLTCLYFKNNAVDVYSTHNSGDHVWPLVSCCFDTLEHIGHSFHPDSLNFRAHANECPRPSHAITTNIATNNSDQSCTMRCNQQTGLLKVILLIIKVQAVTVCGTLRMPKQGSYAHMCSMSCPECLPLTCTWQVLVPLFPSVPFHTPEWHPTLLEALAHCSLTSHWCRSEWSGAP